MRKFKINIKGNIVKKKGEKAFISQQRGYKSSYISESRFLSIQILAHISSVNSDVNYDRGLSLKS